MSLAHRRPGISTPKGTKYPTFRRALGLSDCFKPGSDRNDAEKADLDRKGAMGQAPACSVGMQCRRWDLSVACACSWVAHRALSGGPGHTHLSPVRVDRLYTGATGIFTASQSRPRLRFVGKFDLEPNCTGAYRPVVPLGRFE